MPRRPLLPCQSIRIWQTSASTHGQALSFCPTKGARGAAGTDRGVAGARIVPCCWPQCRKSRTERRRSALSWPGGDSGCRGPGGATGAPSSPREDHQVKKKNRESRSFWEAGSHRRLGLVFLRRLLADDLTGRAPWRHKRRRGRRRKEEDLAQHLYRKWLKGCICTATPAAILDSEVEPCVVACPDTTIDQMRVICTLKSSDAFHENIRPGFTPSGFSSSRGSSKDVLKALVSCCFVRSRQGRGTQPGKQTS